MSSEDKSIILSQVKNKAYALNSLVKVFVEKYMIKSSIKNSKLRNKQKKTFTFSIEGAYIHCLPSLHLFQRG